MLHRTPPHPRTLARLKRQLQQAGVTQLQVAIAAGVVKQTVTHVLAGRYRSANIVGTAKRLLADAKNGPTTTDRKAAS